MKISISDDVRAFLHQDVVSAECLHVLLLIRRRHERWWGAQELASELDMPADVVQAQLERLGTRNLLDVRVAESLGYRYRPANEELGRIVDDVSRSHLENRDAVYDLVADNARSARRIADVMDPEGTKDPT